MTSIYFEFFFHKVISLLLMITSIYVIYKKTGFFKIASIVILLFSIFYMIDSLKSSNLDLGIHEFNRVQSLIPNNVINIELIKRPNPYYATIKNDTIIDDVKSIETMIALLKDNKSLFLDHPHIYRESLLKINCKNDHPITFIIYNTHNQGLVLKLIGSTNKKEYFLGFYTNKRMNTVLKKFY